MSKEVEPCPFCEGEAFLRSEFGTNSDTGHVFPRVYFVLCDNCGASSARVDTREKAIALWNSRVKAPKEERQPNFPLPVPSLGNCTKCGAPYVSYTGPWHATIPPPIRPSCNCRGHLIKATSSTKGEQ